MPRSLVDLPAAEVGLDLGSGHQIAVRIYEAIDSERLPTPTLVCLGDQRIRPPALTSDLDAALQHPFGVPQVRGHVRVVGVHPELTASRVDDRSRQPVVVGMRVGAYQEADVF